MAANILYATLPNEIVIIRIRGRGDHRNSFALRKVLEQTSSIDRCPRYLLDMEECTTMDSTFLGVVGSVGLRQQRLRRTKAVVVNADRRVKEQLDMLGLKYILDIRDRPPKEALEHSSGKRDFVAARPPEVSRMDRIIHMIEAHERLIAIDSGNEIKFRDVLHSLRQARDETGED